VLKRTHFTAAIDGEFCLKMGAAVHKAEWNENIDSTLQSWWWEKGEWRRGSSNKCSFLL